LANAAKHEILRVALRSSIASYAGFPRTPRVTLALAKLTHRVRSLSKLASITRYKHFCLLLGRGRTYSRSIGLARHSFRKLAGTGFISGLYK
jgi:ribosomal protein S14